MPVPDTINSVELRRVLESSFNEEELKTLCFDLSIDYEALAASGKAAKCREIVLHAERIECLNELWDLVVELRPHLINLYSEGDFPTEELFEDPDLTLLKRLTLKSERYSKLQQQLIISNENFKNEYLRGIKLPGEIRLPELPGGKKLAGELKQVRRTIIYGTDLGRANLSDSFIQSVDLQRVILDEAILEKADFRNARFFESSLKSANLSEADLSSTELLGGERDCFLLACPMKTTKSHLQQLLYYWQSYMVESGIFQLY